MKHPHDLLQYEAGRGYPERDDDLLKLIEAKYQGCSFLILNSGTGLFGQRLIDRQGLPTTAIERDLSLIGAGREAGIRMQSHQIELTDASLLLFGRIIDMHGVTTIVAQNCMVEILANPELDTGKFIDCLVGHGVHELFIEDDDPVEAIVDLSRYAYCIEFVGRRMVYLFRERDSTRAAGTA